MRASGHVNKLVVREIGKASVAGKCRTLPAIVSLFSGAGGLDFGFESAGFRLGIALDNCSAAIATHKQNFRGTPAYVEDLALRKPADTCKLILRHIPRNSKIGVIGGPPCQGFSRSNTNSSSEDPRNSLIKNYINLVGMLQLDYEIEFAVFENVLGFLDDKHRKHYKTLVKGFNEMGLKVNEQVLQATDFGVPQYRKRVIITASKHSAAIEPLSKPSGKALATVRSTIGGLREPAFFKRNINVEEIPLHPNHWTMNPKSQRFKELCPPGTGRSFRKLEWDSPSPTIAMGHREIPVHPSGYRRLSIYEAMLLQGFSKDFVFLGTLSKQVEQVSNAVPPPVAEAVAINIRKGLESLPQS